MLCTRQSGVQPLSHVITPPSQRSCLSLLSKMGKKNNKRLQATCRMADVGNYFSASLNTITLLVMCFSQLYIRYLCKAGLRRRNPYACCPFHLRDKQEESCGAAGNKLPTPSPSGHGAFYIPPSISITISVSSPHARHNVDDSVEGT